MSASKQEDPSPHQDLPIAKSSSFVPHEENIDGSQSKRVNNETHGLLDVAMKSELAEGTLDNDEDVIELAIPEEQVPFDGDLIYDDVVDENGVPFYDGQKWHGFPGHNNKNESIPAYLEDLARAVHRIVEKCLYIFLFLEHS